jgi:chorismate--pyruvate lyase
MANKITSSRWVVHDCWLRSRVLGRMRTWLLDAGSLTDRLRTRCQGCFSVRVVAEGWQRPRLDEARALGMRRGTLGWVREVQLLCDGEPQVFARTIVPVKTLSGAQRQLAHLGNRPLGAYLFADPSMQRTAVELACIHPGQAMFVEATEGLERKPPCIWGRRSVFRIGGKPLLVTEVFLPNILPQS